MNNTRIEFHGTKPQDPQSVAIWEQVKAKHKEMLEAQKKVWEEKQKEFEASKKPEGFLAKASKYIKAEVTHATQGAVSDEIFQERKSKCMDCHGRVESLEGNIDPGGIGFCNLCGCGGSRRAALSVKLTMSAVVCPLNKFAKSQGTGGTLASALEAAKGVASSIVDQAKRAL